MFSLRQIGVHVYFLLEQDGVCVLHPLPPLLALQVVDDVLRPDHDGRGSIAIHVFDLHPPFAVDLNKVGLFDECFQCHNLLASAYSGP